MKPERHEHLVWRVASCSIDQDVQGLGPARWLEMHNLVHAVALCDVGIVWPQQMCSVHHKDPASASRRFTQRVFLCKQSDVLDCVAYGLWVNWGGLPAWQVRQLTLLQKHMSQSTPVHEMGCVAEFVGRD